MASHRALLATIGSATDGTLSWPTGVLTLNANIYLTSVAGTNAFEVHVPSGSDGLFVGTAASGYSGNLLQLSTTDLGVTLNLDASGNLTVLGNIIIGGGSAVSQLRFLEGSAGGTNYTGFKSPATLAANIVYELPAAFPASNKILQSDSSGVLTWVTDTTGSGTVTTVGWTGGIVSIANPTTAPAFTIAGTSGGIPYFSSATTWATSAALAASALVIGGGAGAAPATTTTGTGVITALGVAANGAGGFVTDSGTVTLTNKTFTTPKFASGGFIADANGNELLIFTTTASAVNELTYANAAAGGNPSFTATGGSTDVSINLVPKGAGAVLLPSGTDGVPGLAFAANTGIGISLRNSSADGSLNSASGPMLTWGPSSGVLIRANGGATIIDTANYYLKRSGSTILEWVSTGVNITGNITATTGIVGTTTNDSAAAGAVGQIITASLAAGSATALTSGTAKTITSMSLTAGDWDVEGVVDYVPAATTTTAYIQQGASTTTNTLGAADTFTACSGGNLTGTVLGSLLSENIPVQRISIASTTTVYLVGLANFAVSTMTGYGTIRARRVR